MQNIHKYSVIRDHANGMMLAGKFITIHARKRPEGMNPYINGQTFPGRSVPRIEVYYPLAGTDTHDDVVAHECAHIYYADMRLDKFYPEVEAIKIIANIEPELIDFYSSRSDLGEECVVRLADLRRQGHRLPRMSPRLSAITRTLSRPKPFRAALFCAPLIAAVMAFVVPLAVLS